LLPSLLHFLSGQPLLNLSGIDNPVENTIRPIAINRKNALFAGHDEGGKNWGLFASLIGTCKLNDGKRPA